MSELHNKIDPDDLEELREQGIVPLSPFAVHSFRALCCIAVCFGLAPILLAECQRIWNGGSYGEFASAVLPWLAGLLLACFFGSLLAVLFQTKGLFRLKFVGFGASRLTLQTIKPSTYFWRLIAGLLILAGGFLCIGLFIYAGTQRILPLLNRTSGRLPEDAEIILRSYGFILLFTLLIFSISAWLVRRFLFMLRTVKK